MLTTALPTPEFRCLEGPLQEAAITASALDWSSETYLPIFPGGCIDLHQLTQSRVRGLEPDSIGEPQAAGDCSARASEYLIQFHGGGRTFETLSAEDVKCDKAVGDHDLRLNR